MSYKAWSECVVVGGLGVRETHHSFLEKVVEGRGHARRMLVRLRKSGPDASFRLSGTVSTPLMWFDYILQRWCVGSVEMW